MPFATNNGIKIRYEIEGKSDAPALILQHGSASNLENWRLMGYTDDFGKDYRLILLDARGCGKSDKPHEPAEYTMSKYIGDFVAILDDLKIEKANFLGYSMGGRIGLHIPMYAPTRFISLVMGGAVYPVSGKDAAAYDDVGPAFVALGKAIGLRMKNPMEAYVAVIVKNMGKLEPVRLKNMLAQDGRAIYAGYQARKLETDPPARDYLPTINLPSLFFVGEADPRCYGALETANTIPGGQFFSLPGLNHTQTNMRSDLVLPPVKKFLAEVNWKAY